MKLFIVSTLIVTLLSQIAFADCAQPVTYLIAGTAAPCTGYLHTAAQQEEDIQLSQKYKLTDQELTYTKQASDLKDKQIVDLTGAYNDSQKQVDLWKTEAQSQATQNQQLLKDQTTNHLLWFGGGVLATILLTFAIGKAIKTSTN